MFSKSRLQYNNKCQRILGNKIIFNTYLKLEETHSKHSLSIFTPSVTKKVKFTNEINLG